eukprot:symbB.v1.2.027546.t1/scaffold2835.1/size69263/3
MWRSLPMKTLKEIISELEPVLDVARDLVKRILRHLDHLRDTQNEEIYGHACAVCISSSGTLYALNSLFGDSFLTLLLGGLKLAVLLVGTGAFLLFTGPIRRLRTAYNASCLLARCHRWRLRGGCQRWKFFRPSEGQAPRPRLNDLRVNSVDTLDDSNRLCFAGLLGPEKKNIPREDRSDGSGKSPSWATLPVPVSNETLASWLPISQLEEKGKCVLFVHLGSFDLVSLELSGCTRRDLLLLCEEKLAELQLQASKISVVVDLHHVKLEQLNSHWWKILAPRLLQLVDKNFPEFLDELLFLRANRLSSLAAERLLNLSRPHLRDLIVLGGDEIAAQTFLESRGLGFVSDCFFRDPTMSAVEAAQECRVKARRRRRCCRWSCTVLMLLLALLLLESALGLPALSGVYLISDFERWNHLHLLGFSMCLAMSAWLWRPRLGKKEHSDIGVAMSCGRRRRKS